MAGRATWLQNRAAGRDFHGGNSPAEQHHQSIAVSTAQDAGILSQRRDDVVYCLILAAGVVVLVRDIRAFTADESDAEHDWFHGYEH